MDPAYQKNRIRIGGYAAGVAIHPASEDSAPSILALHGFTGSGEDFTPLRKALGQEAAHWICPDFMGHGTSASPDTIDPYTLPMTLRLIDQARQMAPDPDKVLLLGYSMGGRLALHYLRYALPVPAILIGASPGLSSVTEREARREKDQAWISLLENSIGEFCSAWEEQALIEPQTTLAEPLRSEIAARRRANSATGLRNSILACGTGVLSGLWEKLAHLPPMDLLHGEHDLKFKAIAESMQRENRAIRIREVAGAGHAAHLEAPESCAAILGEALNSALFR